MRFGALLERGAERRCPSVSAGGVTGLCGTPAVATIGKCRAKQVLECGLSCAIFVTFSAVTATDVDRMRSVLKAYLREQGFDDAGAEAMAKYYGGADKLEKVTLTYETAGNASEADIDIEAGCVP